ncbi:MAG: phage holin family protein [Deltaproteobacteria bacterium]|nr:phage holin family protein [Deltaproteobacteria bacterium]
MAAEDREPNASRPTGLFGPLSAILTTLLTVLRTRLELISTEIEAERERLKEMILLSLIVVFCASLGVLLLTFFVVALFWETHRLYILGGLAVLYLTVSLIVGLILRKKALAKPKLLSATLTELAKDYEHLKS